MKKQILWSATTIIALTANTTAAGSEADLSSSHDNFCQVAQQLMVDTDMVSANVVYANDLDGFIESKASEWPLQTHQYPDTLLPDGSRADFPVTLSCKLKTAERINNALAENGQADSALQARAERSCRHIHEAMWAQLLERLALAGEAPVIEAAFDRDDNTVIGPLWLRPWPYQVAYKEGARTHFRSKSLYVEHAWWIPMPDSFMGTHYCHLASPEYMHRLATGEVAAPALLED